MKKTALMAGMALASGLVASTAMAHESRTIAGPNPAKDAYEIVFGFAEEPAFEDSYNGFEVFLFYDDGSADGEAVNTSNGDIVTFTNAEAHLLDQQIRPDDPNFSSHIVESYTFDLNDRNQLPRKAFGTLNEYRNRFRPTIDGPYAFHIAGTIQEVNHDKDASNGPNKPTGLTTFDETFSCGPGGTLDFFNGTPHSFNCVENSTVFPASNSAYRDD